jgi:ribonuclease P protein component
VEPYSLPRKQRLRGYGSFTRIMAGGVSVAAGPLRCFVLSKASSDPTVMAGFAVTKSVRGSVHRNRVRRLMREAYRTHKESLLEVVQQMSLSVQLVILYAGPPPSAPGRLHRRDIDKPMTEALHKITRRL